MASKYYNSLKGRLGIQKIEWKKSLNKQKSLLAPDSLEGLKGSPFESKYLSASSFKDLIKNYQDAGKTAEDKYGGHEARRKLFWDRVHSGINTLSSTSPSWHNRKKLGDNAKNAAPNFPPKDGNQKSAIEEYRNKLVSALEEQRKIRIEKFLEKDAKLAWGTIEAWINKRAKLGKYRKKDKDGNEVPLTKSQKEWQAVLKIGYNFLVWVYEKTGSDHITYEIATKEYYDVGPDPDKGGKIGIIKKTQQRNRTQAFTTWWLKRIAYEELNAADYQEVSWWGERPSTYITIWDYRPLKSYFYDPRLADKKDKKA